MSLCRGTHSRLPRRTETFVRPAWTLNPTERSYWLESLRYTTQVTRRGRMECLCWTTAAPGGTVGKRIIRICADMAKEYHLR